MNHRQRFVGLDVGTSAAKAALVEVRGSQAAERRSTTVEYNAANQPSRDPACWVRASAKALDDLELDDVEGLSGVGFTGQMHALVIVGADLEPVLPAMLWLDYQGARELDRFVTRHPQIDFVQRTGNVPLPDFTLAKWLYLNAAGTVVPKQATAVVGAKDYVRTRLVAGRFLTDVNEASGTQYYDPFAHCWAADVLSEALLPQALLPEVVGPSHLTGPLELTSGRLGPCPAVVGSGDQATASRATGGHRRGTVSLSLGTSGVVSTSFPLDRVPGKWDGRFHLFPLDASHEYQLIGTVPSVGPTLRWLAGLCQVDVRELSALARSARTAPDGLDFFPYLGGRGAPNADADQRGALVGLTDKTTPGQIAAAVYRGIGLEVGAIVDDMRSVGAVIDQVVFSGGGSLDSSLVETIAACLDVPCFVAVGANASATGAALLAQDAVSGGMAPQLDWAAVTPASAIADSARWKERQSCLLPAEPRL